MRCKFPFVKKLAKVGILRNIKPVGFVCALISVLHAMCSQHKILQNEYQLNHICIEPNTIHALNRTQFMCWIILEKHSIIMRKVYFMQKNSTKHITIRWININIPTELKSNQQWIRNLAYHNIQRHNVYLFLIPANFYLVENHAMYTDNQHEEKLWDILYKSV